MKLNTYNNDAFERGKSAFTEAVWLICSGLLFSSWIPGSPWRRVMLRLFGAQVGNNVVIKPGVRVTFPWKFQIGDDSWLGASVWIDNLERVEIGSNCCISQGAFFCTGNHRWEKQSFDLEVKPIVVEDECWVAAGVMLSPGTVLRQGAVVTMGQVASGEYKSWTVYKEGQSIPRKQDDV